MMWKMFRKENGLVVEFGSRRKLLAGGRDGTKAAAGGGGVGVGGVGAAGGGVGAAGGGGGVGVPAFVRSCGFLAKKRRNELPSLEQCATLRCR